MNFFREGMTYRTEVASGNKCNEIKVMIILNNIIKFLNVNPLPKIENS